jgi:hypothetical protein
MYHVKQEHKQENWNWSDGHNETKSFDVRLLITGYGLSALHSLPRALMKNSKSNTKIPIAQKSFL